MQGENMIWSLRFQTGEYYGEGKTFWPEVELKFWVKEGEHYHVPLLLGPWSYTTYRGS
jgi:5-hydroxyisourate hydrolase